MRVPASPVLRLIFIDDINGITASRRDEGEMSDFFHFLSFSPDMDLVLPHDNNGGHIPRGHIDDLFACPRMKPLYYHHEGIISCRPMKTSWCNRLRNISRTSLRAR